MTRCITLWSLQAPIPGVVLSYRLSRSMRGWQPGHHELASSQPDEQQHQRQQQQQQQQQQQPDSEYGAIAKFAGMIIVRYVTLRYNYL